MQYSYQLAAIKPVRVTVDEDGDTHAIYDLPVPKPWEFTYWIGEMENEVELQREVMVTRVRVVLWVDEETGEKQATVIPFDEWGDESPANWLTVHNASSLVSVLTRLGFAPLLPIN